MANCCNLSTASLKCLEEVGGELGVEWAQALLCPRFLHVDTAILSTLTLEVAIVSSVPSASVSTPTLLFFLCHSVVVRSKSLKAETGFES